MGSLYARGQRLYAQYKDSSGKRRQEVTPYLVGQERLAEEFVAALERGIVAGDDLGPLTVKKFCKRWSDARRARQLRCATTDERRIEMYALPSLGTMPLHEVRPRHVRELVRELKAKCGAGKGQLAPRSALHVYRTLHTMFADAVVDELIPSNPCIVKRGELPKKLDKNPTWRASAVFSREEVEQIISSPIISDDRRAMYALMFLTGCRFGEIAALRWSDYDTSAEPLGRLLVARSYDGKLKVEKSTKSGVTREVPVHRTLSGVLAEWRLKGWPALFGRAPRHDDLIIPSREGEHRSRHHSLHKFHDDLALLGFRARRQHDSRRTFISLARTDGARSDILESITHGPRGDIMNVYTTLPWHLLCEEVAKLKIERRKGQLIALPKAVGAENFTTELLQPAQVTRNKEERNWRRWESNPGPKSCLRKALRA